MAIAEVELKSKIIDFLQLADSCRDSNDYDTTTSYRKKIIDETPLDKLLEYCKLLYDNGRFEQAHKVAFDIHLICSRNDTTLPKALLALWLIFCIKISTNVEMLSTFKLISSLTDQFREKMEEDLKKFNFESSERINWDFRHVLIHRSYLLHYGLFLITNNENLEFFLDFIIEDRYFSLIESSFSYMIKYAVVLTIILKKRSYISIISACLKNNQTTNDPFAKLFLNIFENYDLETSINLVELCSKEVSYDYFIKDYQKEFELRARELIIEIFIISNEKINLNYFSNLFKNSNINQIKDLFVLEIKSLYPLSKIKESEENKNVYLSYDNNSNMLENITLLKIEELVNKSKSMVDILKYKK